MPIKWLVKKMALRLSFGDRKFTIPEQKNIIGGIMQDLEVC